MEYQDACGTATQAPDFADFPGKQSLFVALGGPEGRARRARCHITVIRNLVDPEACQYARQMVDKICGPPGQQIEIAALDLSRSYKDGAHKGSTGFVYANSNTKVGVVNMLGRGRNRTAAAAIVAPMVPLQLDLLRCTSPTDLKLLNQNFRRTDRSPESGHNAGTKQAWHMDSAFLPRHYTTTPRQNYYISVLALSHVREGVEPFMMVPGSLSAALAAAGEALPQADQDKVDGLSCRTQLPGRFLKDGVQDVIEANPAGRAMTMEEGDMLILDPMTTHSGSPCHSADARYVCFSTFFDNAVVGITLVASKRENTPHQRTSTRRDYARHSETRWPRCCTGSCHCITRKS
jgi:hypothetical protein